MVKIVLRVDLEKIFMNEFSIKKKPDDIFSLIEFAISVAEVKYPTALDKHKHRMLNRLMNSGRYKEEEEEKSGMLKEDIHEKLGTKERNKKTDFESSKRKFEQRSAEQKEAKRRIVMLE
ncbi:hypothetical protein MTR67_004038 [Solanum verrucosum]|uniref:Uncharacterized protein n=1 Tax=Solanum verrucosum TaxID=315347 RepID=A0AAF0PTN5_SOLVR|nr:hypothetical protein MTR67_004038 [Solanum verrucosum]